MALNLVASGKYNKKREGPVQFALLGKFEGKPAHVIKRWKHCPCEFKVSYGDPQTEAYYGAVLGRTGHVLGSSHVVSVDWVAKEATLISVTNRSATASEYFGNDPRANGQVLCAGSTPFQDECDVHQNVVSAGGMSTVTITATVNGPLPAGETLLLNYSGGGGLDPNYKQCSPATAQYGQTCVVAFGNPNPEKAEATISVPNKKTDYGGMHTMNLQAKVVRSGGDAAAALLVLQLCQYQDDQGKPIPPADQCG